MATFEAEIGGHDEHEDDNEAKDGEHDQPPGQSTSIRSLGILLQADVDGHVEAQHLQRLVQLDEADIVGAVRLRRPMHALDQVPVRAALHLVLRLVHVRRGEMPAQRTSIATISMVLDLTLAATLKLGPYTLEAYALDERRLDRRQQQQGGQHNRQGRHCWRD